LDTKFRTASVAFSRLNGTILAQSFTKKPAEAAPTNSSEILQAWDNFLGLGDGMLEQAYTRMGKGSGSFLFPSLVSWFLNGISTLAAENPAADTRGVNALQALLAIPLYYCQTGGVERLAMPSLPSRFLLSGTDAVKVSAGVERNSPIFLAVLQNEIAVSRGTLIAYALLSAVTLMLCFVALGIGSFTETAGTIPATTSFPAFDFCTNCVVSSTDDRIVTERGPFQAIQGLREVYEKGMINRMKVKLAEPEYP
jgi:hypothetical protein